MHAIIMPFDKLEHKDMNYFNKLTTTYTNCTQKLNNIKVKKICINIKLKKNIQVKLF